MQEGTKKNTLSITANSRNEKVDFVNDEKIVNLVDSLLYFLPIDEKVYVTPRQNDRYLISFQYRGKKVEIEYDPTSIVKLDIVTKERDLKFSLIPALQEIFGSPVVAYDMTTNASFVTHSCLIWGDKVAEQTIREQIEQNRTRKLTSTEYWNERYGQEIPLDGSSPFKWNRSKVTINTRELQRRLGNSPEIPLNKDSFPGRIITETKNISVSSYSVIDRLDQKDGKPIFKNKSVL